MKKSQKNIVVAGIPKTEAARKFVVSEFFTIPLIREKGGRRIDEKATRELLQEHSNITGKRGCYVFGIQVGRCVVPVYVGRTTKQTLAKESCTSHKLKKINSALLQMPKKKLVLAFVVPEDDRKRVCRASLEEMEQILIQYAHEKNPNIQNERGIIKYKWYIDGVINSGPGRKSVQCPQFRRMLGIK